MKQPANVLRLLPDGSAEVAVLRSSACGSCEGCSGCGAERRQMTLTAENPIGAKAGDRVVLQSESKTVLSLVLAVYVLPIVLFFAGYALGSVIRWHPALCGIIGFALSVLPVVLLDRLIRKKHGVRYVLTAFEGN